MDTASTDLLQEHPDWRLVLVAYLQAEQDATQHVALGPAARRADDVQASEPADAADSDAAPEADAAPAPRRMFWLRRLTDVAGVPPAVLASVHGRLIAEGLLQFELGGRDEGVVYRLTREARQLLAALSPNDLVTFPAHEQLDSAAATPCENQDCSTETAVEAA